MTTRLITDPDDRQVWTLARSTDVRTAITRGLADYLRGLSVVVAGGRKLHFKKVLEAWSEPEQPAEYPSACVYGLEPGAYDADALTPQTVEVSTAAGKRFIRLTSEYAPQILVECWMTDSAERTGLCGMLEDALCPVPWMYGLRLELPHYFNARATFDPVSSAYVDSADDAGRRYRKAVFVLTATCPVVRLAGADGALPEMQVRIDVELDGAFRDDVPTFQGARAGAGGASVAARGVRGGRGGATSASGARVELGHGGVLTQPSAPTGGDPPGVT